MKECAACGKAFHYLAGAVSEGGGPWRHIDCIGASRIDYAASFDKLYQLVLDAGYVMHDLMERSAGDEDFERQYDPLLIQIAGMLAEGTSWRTYVEERHVA